LILTFDAGLFIINNTVNYCKIHNQKYIKPLSKNSRYSGVRPRATYFQRAADDAIAVMERFTEWTYEGREKGSAYVRLAE
jgi:hypothetical protein